MPSRTFWSIALCFWCLSVPAQEKQEKTEKPAASPAPSVRLLEPGAEPRRELRYKFKMGRPETLVLEARTAAASELGGFKLPEMQMPLIRTTLTLEPSSVSPEGELRYEFKVLNHEVVSGEGDNPAMVGAMEAAFQNFRVSGSSLVAAQGLVKEVDLKLPAQISPQARQALDSVRQSLRQLPAHFPREPVGKGARWEVTAPLDTPGMTVTQSGIYTLSELDGDTGKLQVTVKQSAPPQKMQPPGLPPGTTASLESMSSSGEGSHAFDLSSLVPRSALRLTSEMQMSMGSGAQTQKVKMRMRMESRIGKEATPPVPLNAKK